MIIIGFTPHPPGMPSTPPGWHDSQYSVWNPNISQPLFATRSPERGRSKIVIDSASSPSCSDFSSPQQAGLEPVTGLKVPTLQWSIATKGEESPVFFARMRGLQRRASFFWVQNQIIIFAWMCAAKVYTSGDLGLYLDFSIRHGMSFFIWPNNTWGKGNEIRLSNKMFLSSSQKNPQLTPGRSSTTCWWFRNPRSPPDMVVGDDWDPKTLVNIGEKIVSRMWKDWFATHCRRHFHASLCWMELFAMEISGPRLRVVVSWGKKCRGCMKSWPVFLSGLFHTAWNQDPY